MMLKTARQVEVSNEQIKA